VLLAGTVVFAFGQRGQAVTSLQSNPVCPVVRSKINLAFILDSSGSMANSIDHPSPQTTSRGRGQTYNIQVKGVIRALSNINVIPRDGSIAVTVITFNEGAFIPVPLTEIRTESDAESIIDKVKALICTNPDELASPCPLGSTSFTNAILKANMELVRGHLIQREAARRVFLISTDGESTDPDKGANASHAVEVEAASQMLQAELDVILMGLSAERGKEDLSESERNERTVKEIVFPLPETDLPGKIFNIKTGPSNLPGTCPKIADCSNKVVEDINRQTMEFADNVRKILRSDVPSRRLVVSTNDDTAPNTQPIPNGSLSLRQAIELANCNGGSTTITFAQDVKGKAISPSTPLPALTAPDITIDGLDFCFEPLTDPMSGNCLPSVTIDGGRSLSDGIVIRSNNDVVRGLRITRFQRAGIAIDPASSSDNVGYNLIELNTLENNSKAGICVVDAPSDRFRAVSHNVGNTFSLNRISGSQTLIDLGCDGPTPNDEGDSDEGPNRLLNFPDSLRVENAPRAPATFDRITGQLNSSPGGGFIEVFAVTKLGNTPGKVVMDEVLIAARVPFTGNTFTIAEVRKSPTGIYTATVTDLDGNTSELMIICDKAATAIPQQQTLEFEKITLRRRPGHNLRSLEFTLGNMGCAPLTNLRFESLKRVIKRANSLERVGDESGVFSIVPIEPQISFPITINPGATQRFKVSFRPRIPAFVEPGPSYEPETIMPLKVEAELLFNSDGGEVLVTLLGRIEPKVYLINPDDTRQAPVVMLERSGDLFNVMFYVFDADPFDIVRATFEFFDMSGNKVQEPFTALLEQEVREAIEQGKNEQHKKLEGQSLSVLQRFSNAKNHPEVGSVRVTVFGKAGSSATAISTKLNTSQAVSLLSRLPARNSTLLLPHMTLTAAVERTSPRAGKPMKLKRRVSHKRQFSDMRRAPL
jgi:hypothetical protein